MNFGAVLNWLGLGWRVHRRRRWFVLELPFPWPARSRDGFLFPRFRLLALALVVAGVKFLFLAYNIIFFCGDTLGSVLVRC